MDLIADIGATNTRCALLDEAGGQHSVEVFANASFAGIESLLETYLEPRGGRRIRRAALAVAAPVTGDRVAMVNIDWTFSQSALERHLGVDELRLVNDFAALARALPELGPDDLRRIGGGETAPNAAMVALGPGSGLGVGGIAPAPGGDWAVVGGEGGHVTLAAASDDEQAVVSAVRRRRGHCAAETLLSGPGLATLYATLAELDGRAPQKLEPRDVTRLALEGDPVAARAFEMFFTLLGTVASDLALVFGARGGVYLGGGIVPRFVEAIERSGFRERFLDKGEYRAYLESIPTFVITKPLPALQGLRALLGYPSRHDGA